MLKITVPAEELFDEVTMTFKTVPEVVVELEHSLVSLSKWESIHEKPFLGKDEKTDEEIYSYIGSMFLDDSLDQNVITRMTQTNIQSVNDYVGAPHTATTFSNQRESKSGSSEVITSELIYYWLVALEIPFEVQTWNLNRLFTLVRIANIKNSGEEKKMTRGEIAERNRKLNEERRKKHQSKG